MRTTFVVPGDLRPLTRAASAPPPGEPIPPHNRFCYGCGPEAPHGLHLTMDAGPGVSASGRMTVRREHEGGPGVIHGGILAGAFDEVMGQCMMLTGESAVTAVLDVDYARPIPVEAVIRFETEIVGIAGRKMYGRAQAFVESPGDAQTQPSAGAHGMFVVIDPFTHFDQKDLRRAAGPNGRGD